MTLETPRAGCEPAREATNEVLSDLTNGSVQPAADAIAAHATDPEPSLETEPSLAGGATSTTDAASQRERFAQLPKRLHRAIDVGEIDATDLFLIVYLALAGADLDGATTTYANLATAANCSSRTIERHLPALKRRGYLEYEIRPGQRKPFVIRLGEAARVRPPTRPPTTGARDGGTTDTTYDSEGRPMSEVVSEVTSAATSATNGHATHREPASQQAATAATTSATTSDASRARAETDTDRYIDDVVVEDEHLRHLLQTLGPIAPSQRDEIRAAYLENPDGVRRIIDEAVRNGDRPAAIVTNNIRGKAHLNGRKTITLAEQLTRWLAGPGQLFTEDGARELLESSFNLSGEDLEQALERRKALSGRIRNEALAWHRRERKRRATMRRSRGYEWRLVAGVRGAAAAVRARQ